MKKYIVLQGKLNKNGSGDLEIDKVFINKQEAIKHFNDIKRDINGWVGVNKGDVLVTAVREKDDVMCYLGFHEEKFN